MSVQTWSRKALSSKAWGRSLGLAIVVASSMAAGYAIGAQPHMDAAITLLRNARAELGAATPNKGGHREKAIGLIDQAIAQVREGIAFGATH